jgi:hypothetical protein
MYNVRLFRIVTMNLPPVQQIYPNKNGRKHHIESQIQN